MGEDHKNRDFLLVKMNGAKIESPTRLKIFFSIKNLIRVTHLALPDIL